MNGIIDELGDSTLTAVMRSASLTIGEVLKICVLGNAQFDKCREILDDK